MSTSTLTIAASTINRPASRIILNNWTISLDRPDELEFTERAANLPGTYAPEAAVTLTIGGVTVFNGHIFSRHPSGAGTGEITIGYLCLNLKYTAYQIPVTASDGTGQMNFNLPTTDPLYQSTQAGFSVGSILSEVFSVNASQLSAAGITTDSTTTTQLAALDVVPPDPVYFAGNSLWAQVDQLLQTWYGSRYASYIDGAGLIRIIDTTTLTAHTLTLGTDPCILSSMTEDTSESFTQVIVRGRSNIEPATLSLHDGTLIDPHGVSGDNLEASWVYNDFLSPRNGYDQGAITTLTSTTAVLQSDYGTTSVAVNYWPSVSGQISLIFPAGTSITGFEYRRIISNTHNASPGAPYTVTFDSPLVNSGYTRYIIRGVPPGKAGCYREYDIKNTYVAQHLQPLFNFAVPFYQNDSVVLTIYPFAVVSYTSAGIGVQVSRNFELVRYDASRSSPTVGYIRFYEPVVDANNTLAQLNAGGSAVTPPTDIIVMVPYARGTLNAQFPSPGYGGTAYTKFNVQRTLYRDYPNWADPGQLTAMVNLCQAIFNTTSQATQEGQVTFYGLYSPALAPGAPIALNLTHFSQTTGYEAMAAPCRSVTLEWPQSGGAIFVTRLNFSTKRQTFSGDRLYVHSNYAEGGGWSEAMGVMEFANVVSAQSAHQWTGNFDPGKQTTPSGFEVPQEQPGPPAEEYKPEFAPEPIEPPEPPEPPGLGESPTHTPGAGVFVGR